MTLQRCAPRLDPGAARAYDRKRRSGHVLPPVRPITLDEIEAARERIKQRGVAHAAGEARTGAGFPDIRLKLENLQPINAYKLRGAANAVAMLSDDERKRGVWTISAGNAGQGVAYAARAAGVPCKVVVIETAPQAKIERMRALGAELVPVPFESAWRALEERAFPGMDGTLVHPFDDHNFIAGHALDGSGNSRRRARHAKPSSAASAAAACIAGVGSAIKPLRPDDEDFGRRAGDRRALRALSLKAGPARFRNWQSTLRRRRRRPERHSAHVGADAAGGRRRHRRYAG